jgi:hypothetical protein
MEFELLKWGDGTIRLAFWDSDEGKDRIFVLGEDGLAYIQNDETEERTQINLVQELRKMAEQTVS